MYLRCGITSSIDFSLTIWIIGLAPLLNIKNAVLYTNCRTQKNSIFNRVKAAYKGVLRVVKLKKLKNLAYSAQNTSWQVLQP
jgi:hypothetical protein